MTDTRTEPKPASCPFCGQETEYRKPNSYVVCGGFHGCGAQGPSRQTKAETIATWNRIARAGDLPSAEELAPFMIEANGRLFDMDVEPGEILDMECEAALDAIHRWLREREEGGHDGT